MRCSVVLVGGKLAGWLYIKHLDCWDGKGFCSCECICGSEERKEVL